MKIAAQDAKRQVTGKAQFTAVARALQTVAGLQRSDGRFDARMTPPRCTPLQRRIRRLGRRLFGAWLGQTRSSDDLRQVALILWRVEAAIERGFFDGSLQALLHEARLRYDHIAVLLFALEQIRVRDEARRILEDQNQPPKLHRLACLAPLVLLRVRFKQAEHFLL